MVVVYLLIVQSQLYFTGWSLRHWNVLSVSILHDPGVVLTFNLLCLSARSFISRMGSGSFPGQGGKEKPQGWLQKNWELLFSWESSGMAAGNAESRRASTADCSVPPVPGESLPKRGSVCRLTHKELSVHSELGWFLLQTCCDLCLMFRRQNMWVT